MNRATHGSALALALVVSALLACKNAQNLIGGAASSEPVASAAPAAPSATAPAAPSEVTFVKSVPKAGAKVKAETDSNVKFTFQGKVFRSTERNSTAVEVQASDEFRVTKAALDVKELYSTSQEGTGSEKKSVNPLAGSRFIVTRADDGKLSALDSSGNKVAAAQIKEIETNYRSVFERDKSRAFLPNRALKVGEKLTPSADDVLALLGVKDDGSATVDGVEFILKSAAEDKATFAVSLTFTQKIPGGMRLRAKLEGTLDVRPKDSTFTNVSLRGPLTILDAQGNDKGSGELSFTGSETTS
ncbi:MAG TPA: hypothetical protein VMS65_02785 [Polyangiaceae bacterium]|nr:hypothetical protein [Polyangiaceae bacterium]